MRRFVPTIAVVSLMALMAAACSSGTGGSTAAPAPIVVKFTHVAGDFTPKGRAATRFAEIANERGKGRLDVRVYPSGQLYGDKEELEALLANNTQFIAPSIGKLIAFDPRFQIGDMPFLFADNAAETRFWDSETGKQLLATLAPRGMVGFTTWPNGMRQLMNRTRPIRTPGDMRGLKIRVPSGGVQVDTLQVFGAGASVIPFSDTYTALQQGVVDGTLATFDNISVEKYAEVLKYLTVANVNSLSYGVIVNKTFWDGLPPDLRQILSDAMTESTALARKLSSELEAESLASLRKSVDVVELTPEQRQQFVEATRPVLTKYESILKPELLDAARKANQ